MTGAVGLVDTVEGLGVCLTVTVDGRLIVEPGSIIPPDLMDLLRAHRAEIIECIHARAAGRKETPETPETPEDSASTSTLARCFSGVSPDQTPGSGFQFLPRPLVALVQAAKVNSLNRPGFLPSGIVPNLGEYVLTCAALYACGFDPERQLSHLWEARGAWAA